MASLNSKTNSLWFYGALLCCILAIFQTFFLSWAVYQFHSQGTISSWIWTLCWSPETCRQFMGSRWAVILGNIPWGIIGLLLYSFLLWMIFRTRHPVPVWLAGTTAIGAFLAIITGIYATLIMLVYFQQLCLPCLSVHFLISLSSIYLLTQIRYTWHQGLRHKRLITAGILAFLMVIVGAIIQHLSLSLSIPY